MTFDEKLWTDHFIRFEGKSSTFYLDGVGVVTIGIGCQVFQPTTLPMVRRQDFMRASATEIMDDYRAVKALPEGMGVSFYGKVCRLYLPDNEIIALFQSRLMAFIKSVQESIISLEAYPEPAALALVDMAFNLGIAGLKSKFPKFTNAFLAKDWRTCSLECKREGVQRDRNEWTKATFEELEDQA